eukprot:scaffold3520_cov102-Skeletonema_dohrnii-CCMP3373.AAC.1
MECNREEAACQSNEQRVMSNEKRGTYASDTSPTRKRFSTRRKRAQYEDAKDLSLVMERSIGEMERNSNIHEDALCSKVPSSVAQCLMHLNKCKALLRVI